MTDQETAPPLQHETCSCGCCGPTTAEQPPPEDARVACSCDCGCTGPSGCTCGCNEQGCTCGCAPAS